MAEKPRFVFDEVLSGYVWPGETSFEAGYEKGGENDCECRIDNRIEIADMEEFTTLTGRKAKLDGTVAVTGIGKKLKIENGTFSVFAIKDDGETGRTMKTMEYRFDFHAGGEAYHLFGIKKLYHEKGKFDPVSQMTTLYTKILKGGENGELYACGIMHFELSDIFSMFSSMRVRGAKSVEEKARIFAQFMDFNYEELIEIYLNRVGIFYRTDYQNLVLRGKCADGEKSVFFYGGAHDKGFPWGDEQAFSDISLVLENDGRMEKYIAADTILGNMKIDIRDGGENTSRFSYAGKMYRLKEGHSRVSFSDDLLVPDKSDILDEVDAKFDLEFLTEIPKEDGTEVPGGILPLALPVGLKNPFLVYLHNFIKKYATSEHGLGIRLGIRSVSVKKAVIQVDGKDLSVDLSNVRGEAENSTFNFLREPTLYYNYFCGVDPENQETSLHVEGGVLYNDTTHWAKTVFDHAVSAVASPSSRLGMLMSDGKIEEFERNPEPVGRVGDPVLEVNFDHFETGVFQRRAVLINGKNRPVWALEENMKRINLRRILPEKQRKTGSPPDCERSLVAVCKSGLGRPLHEQDPERDRPGIGDNILSLFNLNRKRIPDAVPDEERIRKENDDKRELLREVARETDLTGAMEKRASELGKNPSELKIVIKPNFMFLYNRTDHSTYTDPVLIKELVDIIRGAGFTDISVAEAHSTYGEYFQNRDVRSVAEYIGLDGSGGKYRVADLTLDEQVDPEIPFEGPLKGEKVPKTWAGADFRISFAKNKTHSYAYYTLAIKCVYGALPLGNKFKEYHCSRGIYGTTIEYLLHYPVHFGFIDAYVSADGPFGIFADKTPNHTRTIIGGENIVAVDWVGASKMGLNPMISQYMKKAVEQFGKPRIDLKCDTKDELYDPWINVPAELSKGLNDALDRHYKFGNIMYSVLSNMDEKAFPRKSGDPMWMKALRILDKPIRDMFFIQKAGLMKRAYDKGPFGKPDKSALDK